MQESVNKHDLCEDLGVSLATVNNWIKTKVIPSPDKQNYYSKITYDLIISSVKNNQIRLNSRANRSLLQKKTLDELGITDKNRKALLLNLVNDFEKSELSINEGVLALSLTLLRSNKLIDPNWQPNKNSKFDKKLSDWIDESEKPQVIKALFSNYNIPNFDDDILGAFYSSIQNISQKSKSGSYYTPSKLLEGINIPADKTICDPCCGSGGILLNILSKKHDAANIFARDIDELALKICYINLVLFFNNTNITPNIFKHDITFNNENEQYDYIITNPPWGSKFSIQQKESLIKSYPDLATTEIFSIALYKTCKTLKKNGELYFFLPYSFLNVSAHRNIRKNIINGNNISIKLLGNAFKGVQSEGILLHLKNNSTEENITVQNKNGVVYQIPFLNIRPPDFIINADCNPQDMLIIDKFYNTEHTTLKDAIFSLGIVTGNNKKHLSKEKTADSKVIYRGKDINKYKLLEPLYFLKFNPELFQQTAPVENFQQKKIVYRFISNKLVCALDKDGHLLLNSANLFISNTYSMETIVSLFNSDIYTFIFRKMFHSKKVLKSHLQNLPLPILSNETHLYILNLYKETFSGKNPDIAEYQKKIDKIICEAFGIVEKELKYIREETF